MACSPRKTRCIAGAAGAAGVDHRMTFAYVMNKTAPGVIGTALAERVCDIVNPQATCSTGFLSSSRRRG